MAVLQDKPEDRLLSTRQAAAASGFHQTHFNSQIQAGNLPATKDEKGRWQIKQSDLDAYMKTKSVKPRRNKTYMQTSEAEGETSLLTQLDEKKRKVQNLCDELEASKRIMEEMTRKHAKQMEEQRRALADSQNELGRAKNRIEGLKEENKEMKIELAGHTDFMRETIKDLLVYVTK